MNTNSQRGFSLVEVTLALGVASFCLIALFGLLPIGLNSNEASTQQTIAATLASSVAADLRANPTSAKSPHFQFDRTSSTIQGAFIGLDGGTPAPAPGTTAQYRVTVWLTPPTAPAGTTVTPRSATVARLLITWPAVVDPTLTAAPTKYSGSFETTIGLDRN